VPPLERTPCRALPFLSAELLLTFFPVAPDQYPKMRALHAPLMATFMAPAARHQGHLYYISGAMLDHSKAKLKVGVEKEIRAAPGIEKTAGSSTNP
jgi:hypothetical protein